MTDAKAFIARRPRPEGLAAAAILFCLLCAGGPVQAGDITAFVSDNSPGAIWGTGFGATISTTWFGVLALEGEGARAHGDSALPPDLGITTFTGSALLAPPAGPFTPYGGVGVGVFHENDGVNTDNGTFKAFVLGLKVHVGPLFVLKGEYRKFSLPDDALLPYDKRLSVGAGIKF